MTRVVRKLIMEKCNHNKLLVIGNSGQNSTYSILARTWNIDRIANWNWTEPSTEYKAVDNSPSLGEWREIYFSDFHHNYRSSLTADNTTQQIYHVYIILFEIRRYDIRRFWKYFLRLIRWFVFIFFLISLRVRINC